ncbi:MAG: response regulator [Reyranellaceae bacterium]
MTTSRKLSVLVADDVWGVRESLTAALTAEGHEVVSVADGRQASDALATRAFDVLVCDLWMPGVGGIQVLRGAAERRPGMRLVAMTGGGPGMSMEGATSLAEVWGAEKVFLKPFDERELVAFLQDTPAP